MLFRLRAGILGVRRGHLGRDRLAPPGQPVAEASDVGRAVPGQVPPLARVGLQVIQLGLAVFIPFNQLEMSLADGLRMSALLGYIGRGTEDAIEGRKAFVEKRKPNFKGS